MAFPFVAMPKVPALLERLCEKYGCHTFPYRLSNTDGRNRTTTVIVRHVGDRTLQTVVHDRGGCIVPSSLEKVLLDLDIPLADFGLDPKAPPTAPADIN